MFHWEMVIVARLNKIDSQHIIESINKDLAKGARQYMKKSGQVKVRKMMSEAIDEKIYSRYTPKVYERRGSKGGLKDIKNMKDEVKIDDKSGDIAKGYLRITNKTQRHILSEKLKSKYSYADNKDDFLYSIKDGTSKNDGHVYNLWNSESYEEWGNGGKPLRINAALDKKVQNSKELRSGLKHAALRYARSK